MRPRRPGRPPGVAAAPVTPRRQPNILDYAGRVGSNANLVNESAVRPVQFYPCRSFTPEQCLMLAVLEEAVALVTKPRPKRPAGVRREAQEWIASDDRWWPYSFLNLTDGLGIDGLGLRRKLAGSVVPFTTDRRVLTTAAMRVTGAVVGRGQTARDSAWSPRCQET